MHIHCIILPHYPFAPLCERIINARRECEPLLSPNFGAYAFCQTHALLYNSSSSGQVAGSNTNGNTTRRSILNLPSVPWRSLSTTASSRQLTDDPGQSAWAFGSQPVAVQDDGAESLPTRSPAPDQASPLMSFSPGADEQGYEQPRSSPRTGSDPVATIRRVPRPPRGKSTKFLLNVLLSTRTWLSSSAYPSIILVRTAKGFKGGGL